MVDSICLFEDNYYGRLLPLVYFRPVYDLRCGILTLRDKVKKYYPDIPITLHCREYLAGIMKLNNPGFQINKISGKRCLFINGRAIVDSSFQDIISINDKDIVYIKNDTVVAAVVSTDKLVIPETFSVNDFINNPRKEVDIKIIDYPWDLVNQNGQQIISDFELLASNGKSISGNVYEGAHLLNSRKIFIDKEAKIKPGVVLDAEPGPIYIGKKALILPNAVITGPAFIGDGSIIKIGAKIYENTSIGEMCKVGGEVESSIIHSYSNKQHEGFLGHSYLAMWVNIGADTNNSDLKNNYGNIKVTINGEEVDTNYMFVGLIMGDHSKTGINTMFNTGTVVGVSSNIYGAGYPKKTLPSFSWGGADDLKIYDLNKSLEAAKKVMGRRNIELTEHDIILFKTIFNLTAGERKRSGL